MQRKLTFFIMIAMMAGIVFGLACNLWLDDAEIASLTSSLGIVTELFLRLIKMIIAPLVFATLVSGIAKMEAAAEVRRLGWKAMTWFIGASLISLSLGLLLVNLLQPGEGMIPIQQAAAAPVQAQAFDLHDFIAHIVPQSFAAAMAENQILQIVVFACFVGTAVAAIDDRAPAVMAVVDQTVAIMLKVTGYVMLTAPFAVFASITSTLANLGPGVLLTYLEFVGGFYGALVVLWLLLLGVGVALMRGRARPLLGAVRHSSVIAFSMASSEAAFPRMIADLGRLGLPPRIVGFVLPLGYSFNLDGSMMYCTFATLFIAQAYHIDLSLAQQVSLLLIMMVTSKGMAAMPRASLVVIAGALPYFNIPEAGLLLILAVDHLLDMGRSGTNVLGNSVACVAVSRWEGQFDPAGSGELRKSEPSD